ncbi:MAG: gliding motility-associated C-terminal domain-containing protein [Bacteroidales bacterium]|nr:gliding motility-associated C-terminal domain-containing protein [Bacteroidales bacterium]
MKRFIAIVAALFLFAAANAQTTEQYTGQYTPSTPSDLLDCEDYLWPPVEPGQTQFLPPCPKETVKIKQRWDHVPYPQYREMGWDTAVTCSSRQITLSCTPYIPVQYFNGQYFVDQIPFDPADTSFHSGTRLPNGADDVFCATQTLPPCAAMPGELDTFYFYFFGKLKRTFAAGGNGILSFKNGAGDQYCAWGNWDPLPWNSGSHPNHHHFDAIYGVFQDTYPNANCDPPYGIYYDIQGEYPCRKIMASYNGLPLYNSGGNLHGPNDRSTYQIVCYEASNIIEIHIKHRGINTSWCNANGMIGIQNGSGQPQHTGALGTDTMYVWNNAPAAFYPNTPASIFQGGGNGLSRKYIDNVAYRFTPNGTTQYNSKWYRILDDGTTVELTTDHNDTNGYYIKMQQDLQYDWQRDYPNCPTLTRAVVSPTRVSRYMYRLKFQNAAGHWYDLSDTITVGVDTANTMSVRAVGEPEESRTYNICKTYPGNLLYEYPSNQDTLYTTRRLYRVLNGEEVDLPLSNITFGNQTDNGTIKSMPITIPNDFNEDGVPLNKIDSVYFYMYTKFISGCDNSDQIAINIYPNYDITERFSICDGESLVWNGQTYTKTTQTSRSFHSITGCDSIAHLDLTVLDVSNVPDVISDCKPIEWQNGRTYTTDNSTDTVMLKNQWGCDSIVHLFFTIHPLNAELETSLEYFDLDHLDVELHDISTGNDSRKWVFPSGNIATGQTAYYTLPVELDEADIWLYTHSPYGCVDSTHVVIPFKKENFWVPNVFTPGDPSGNNTFSAISDKTLKQEMQIFDRRGELIFHCEGVDCSWDGRDRNGKECPQGTYVYLIRYTNIHHPHQPNILRGTVTLLR